MTVHAILRIHRPEQEMSLGTDSQDRMDPIASVGRRGEEVMKAGNDVIGRLPRLVRTGAC